jgi:hypothetical protein
LYAQLNAPDLRCLTVLANGNVKLTWLSPSDPNNLFSSYDIYFSIQKNGTYSLISSNLNTLNTNTFVHTSTVSTVQNSYYFIRANYGTANNAVSSDTLETIFLNSYINTQSGTQDLTYNGIHAPKLNSTSQNFILNKEYPLGTWNILYSGNDIIYPDTITACVSAKMNYQVSLADASGCLSVSNLLMGQYKDIRSPERPYVDSISVLPNGNTIVSWQIPVDRDIEGYIMYYNGGASTATIDLVSGRNTTSYTYTTPTANSKQIGLFVQSVDTCSNVSSVNDNIRTMFLETSYDRCAYQTKLKWNKYIWADINGQQIEKLGKYKIYYSVNGSAFKVVGETIDTNFMHSQVTPGKNICYFVRVVNERQTITASSNRSCFISEQVEIPKFLYLRTASVTDNTSIKVTVYIDDSEPYQGIILQRSENGIDFKDIGFITSTGVKNYSYIDVNVKPEIKSYVYRSFIVDNCGNRRDSSNIGKTIVLKVHNDGDQIFTKQLSWNAYSGFAGDVSGYNIYRVINDNLNGAIVGSTDPLTTSYTDNIENAAPQGAKIDYFVEAVEGIANPYGIIERSHSNKVSVYMEGNIFVPNAFAPKGTNSTWLPVTYFIDKTDYHVSVFNRWGKKVFECFDDITSWDGENCIADVYVYLIDYKNARGEYMQVKGSLLLLR